jgi:hypothetical protein
VIVCEPADIIPQEGNLDSKAAGEFQEFPGVAVVAFILFSPLADWTLMRAIKEN